jgi:hypothetical protein
MAILSSTLKALLNDKIINEAFEIARSNRTGILQTVSMGGMRAPYEGYKMSWLDMRVDATSATLATGINDSTTTVVVGAGEGAKFRPGMTFSTNASEEVFLVLSVSTDTLTVAARGFGGSTAAALLSGAVLTIDSVGREENSLAQNDGIFQPDPVENFFQTMDTAVEFSRRALATAQFGNTNDLAFQLSERIRQLTIQVDRALVRGRRATATIGSDTVTYTGGLRFFLDQAGAIKVDSAGALTLDKINSLNAEVVARGGMANTIAVGINQARVLTKLVSGNYSSQRLQDWSADEGSLLSLPTDLPLVGNVNRIVIDTNLADDELIIYDAGKINIVPMASGNADESGAWRTVDATQNGQDGERTRIIGDFAMEIRQSKTHMARMYGITIPSPS